MTTTSRRLGRRVLTVLRSMTVEPVLFFGALSMSFSQIVQGVGLYRAACEQIYSDSMPELDCANLANANLTVNGRAAEDPVQQRVATWNMMLGFCSIAPAMIASVFLGAYGDRHGRKVNMMLGMIGFLLSLYPFVVLFTYPRSVPIYAVVIVNALTSLTGFVSITVISVSAYLADIIEDPDELTVRMSIVTVAVTVASIIGPFVAGVTSTMLTEAQQMVVAEGGATVGVLICLLFVYQVPPAQIRQFLAQKRGQKVAHKPTPTPAAPELDTKIEPKPKLDTVVEEPSQSLCRTTVDLLRETWHTYARPRPSHVRIYLLISAAVYFLFQVTEGARATVFVLYLQKEPLGWTQTEIGYYNAAQNAMSAVGTGVGIVVFKKLLKLTDTFVILIACATHLAEMLIMAFATTSWLVYTSAVVSSLSGLVFPCIQSFVAKRVDRDEVGKAFTIFGVAINVAFLVSYGMYNPIYSATVSTFPGFVFLFAAILQAITFLAVIWLHFDVHFKIGDADLGFAKKLLRSISTSGGGEKKRQGVAGR